MSLYKLKLSTIRQDALHFLNIISFVQNTHPRPLSGRLIVMELLGENSLSNER